MPRRRPRFLCELGSAAALAELRVARGGWRVDGCIERAALFRVRLLGFYRLHGPLYPVSARSRRGGEWLDLIEVRDMGLMVMRHIHMDMPTCRSATTPPK